MPAYAVPPFATLPASATMPGFTSLATCADTMLLRRSPTRTEVQSFKGQQARLREELEMARAQAEASRSVLMRITHTERSKAKQALEASQDKLRAEAAEAAAAAAARQAALEEERDALVNERDALQKQLREMLTVMHVGSLPRRPLLALKASASMGAHLGCRPQSATQSATPARLQRPHSAAASDAAAAPLTVASPEPPAEWDAVGPPIPLLRQLANAPRVEVKRCMEELSRLAGFIKAFVKKVDTCSSKPSSCHAGLLGSWLVALARLEARLSVLDTSLSAGQQCATLSEWHRKVEQGLRSQTSALQQELAEARARWGALAAECAEAREALAAAQIEAAEALRQSATHAAQEIERVRAEGQVAAERAAADAAQVGRSELSKQAVASARELSARDERIALLEAENARWLMLRQQALDQVAAAEKKAQQAVASARGMARAAALSPRPLQIGDEPGKRGAQGEMDTEPSRVVRVTIAPRGTLQRSAVAGSR